MNKNPLSLAWLLLLAGLFSSPHPASAQAQAYWDPTFTYGINGGGTGTWSTSAPSTNWWVSGSTDSFWTNNNIANFGGTPGTVSLGANLTANGLTFTSSNYTISGSDTLTLAGTPTITLPTGTNTISCPISSSAPLTVSGPGTLSLTHSGGNTGLTGGVTINAGAAVFINNVSGLGTGTIADNGTLEVSTGAASFTATITGGSSSVIDVFLPYATGSENVRYDGPTTLTGFTGTINIIAVQGGTPAGPGEGQIIMTNNGPAACTWNIGVGATLLLSTGTGASPYAANVIVNGPGNNQPYGALRMDAVTLTGNVLLNGPGATIGDDSATAASQITGVISDAGQHYGFTRLVSGKTMILSGANTYTGATVFSAGTLQAGSAEVPGVSGPFGASAVSNPGNIVLSGGTLQYSAVNSNDYSGRFAANAGQAYNIDVNGQTVTFATALNSSGATLTLADTAGGGTLSLTGTNTFTGITTVNSGTLDIAGSIAGTVITVNGTGALELDRATALPSGAILTLPSSPGNGAVNLNFSGMQNITTLNFGANNPMPSGTYGSLTNSNVQNPNAAFIGNGVLNVEPPTYWDPGYLASGNGSGGSGTWNSVATNWFIGTNDVKWESNNVANFAGTAGVVTLNANEVADGLTFEAGGYDITNDANLAVLTLGGTPIITLAGGNVEIDCGLGGTAGLTENGSGMLTLTGSNTFTGQAAIGSGCTLVLAGPNAYAGATAIDGGSTLLITNAGNLADGNYPGAMADSGSFIYGGSTNQILSGIISGTGPLTQDGPGTLTLSGLNTFNGPILINNGALAISGFADLNNNPTFNTGGYSAGIDDNGAFIFDSSATQTLSGSINGTGSLTQSGTGPLTLSAQNGYTGPTMIGSGSDLIITGTLEFGNYETNIMNSGAFTYDSAFPQTLAGVISGPGILLDEGSGQLTLSDTNTYTGATSISSGGWLIIGGSGDLGNGAYAANITNAGMFTYNSSTNQILSGVISGAGALAQEGPGMLNLTGVNSYTGGTTIGGAGVLAIGGSGGLGKGSYAGAMDDGGMFIYNSSAKQTLSGAIFDGGSLVQEGSGELILTGDLSFSGGITIGSGSDLVIGGAAALGDGEYVTNIIDNGAFVYDSTAGQTLAGAISGSGALALLGAGELTLTGTNTYMGATVVSNGTLALSGLGSIGNTSSVSISAGAIFDVSALPSPYNFGGASLSAGGSASAAAAINGAAGGIVNAGTHPISLAFAPQTFNGDATHPALALPQGGLTLNGNTVTVNNAGLSPLGVGTYSLIQATAGAISGSATLGGVTGTGLAANTAASLSVSGGTLNLVVVASATSAPSVNSITRSGGNLIFSGTNGPDNGVYYVLTSTNLALPLANWTNIATNTFSATGTFSVTNAVSASPSFFVIEIGSH